jgi:hypothetical protein
MPSEPECTLYVVAFNAAGETMGPVGGTDAFGSGVEGAGVCFLSFEVMYQSNPAPASATMHRLPEDEIIIGIWEPPFMYDMFCLFVS